MVFVAVENSYPYATTLGAGNTVALVVKGAKLINYNTASVAYPELHTNRHRSFVHLSL
jgi:hypothetical protein